MSCTVNINHYYFILAKSIIIVPGGVDTAMIFLFFDKMFDSMNGCFHKTIEGKIYRTAVTKSSIHHKLWASSLNVLRSMSYIANGRKCVNVPTLRNWRTIKGKIEFIFNIL